MFYCFPFIYNYGHCKSKQTGNVPVHSLVVIGEHVSVLVGKHAVVKCQPAEVPYVNLSLTCREHGASRD